MASFHLSFCLPRLRIRRFIATTFLTIVVLASWLTLAPEVVTQMRFLRLIDDHLSATADGQMVSACRRPHLELWLPSIRKFFSVLEPLNCTSSRENFVIVRNGTLVISRSARDKYGQISCRVRPLVRIDDFSEKLGTVVDSFTDRTPITSDFLQVDCVSQKGINYSNVHAAVKRKKSVVERAKRTSLPKKAMGLNVLMFGFDSVSRLSWLRNLPKSHAYFTDELRGVTLEGYNIVGDGTPQALLPILTGHTEEELPEARRGFAGARTVDGHPWIWKRFADAGYATQWGEDGANTGTFTYRMLGFRRQPVDHYYRTYERFAGRRHYGHSARYCIGSESRLDVMLDWIGHFYEAYPTEPKFSFVFHSEYSHGSLSTLRLADEPLERFLRRLKTSGYLNNTLLILMADHGPRFSYVRQTQQGKYEERLPYFSLALPEWFAEKYPAAMRNLRNNRHMLTVPFDIHATLNDVIDYSDLGDVGQASRAISLFQAIPKNRTCSSAGVAPHWCTCLSWTEASLTDEHVISAANQIVNAINELTNETRHVCSRLTLASILKAGKFSPNEDVLKFKQSRDFHGRKADLSDDMKADTEFYQLTIETNPGGGLFEATVTNHKNKHNEFKVNSKEISRINRYGDQPYCVQEKLPHLRPYCYCKIQM